MTRDIWIDSEYRIKRIERREHFFSIVIMMSMKTKNIIRKLLIFFILLFSQQFFTESKAGPFGRCGAIVGVAVAEVDDVLENCIYHFFRCDCARIKESN